MLTNIITRSFVALLAAAAVAACARAKPSSPAPVAVVTPAPTPAPTAAGSYEWEMLGSAKHDVAATGGVDVTGTLTVTRAGGGYEGVLTSSIGPRVETRSVTVTGSRATMLLDSPYGEVRFDWPIARDTIGPWWTLTIRPGDSVGGGLVIVRKDP